MLQYHPRVLGVPSTPYCPTTRNYTMSTLPLQYDTIMPREPVKKQTPSLQVPTTRVVALQSQAEVKWRHTLIYQSLQLLLMCCWKLCAQVRYKVVLPHWHRRIFTSH